MKNRNDNKKLICTALGWSEYDYQLYQFETAYEYLQSRIKIESRISAITGTKAWWMWWNRQWEIIDQQYINTTGLHPDVADRIGDGLRYDLTNLYYQDHNPHLMKVFLSRPAKMAIESEAAGRLTIKKR